MAATTKIHINSIDAHVGVAFYCFISVRLGRMDRILSPIVYALCDGFICAAWPLLALGPRCVCVCAKCQRQFFMLFLLCAVPFHFHRLDAKPTRQTAANFVSRKTNFSAQRHFSQFEGGISMPFFSAVNLGRLQVQRGVDLKLF